MDVIPGLGRMASDRSDVRITSQIPGDLYVATCLDQVWLLKQHLPRGTKLRTSDVKDLFLQMREQA